MCACVLVSMAPASVSMPGRGLGHMAERTVTNACLWLDGAAQESNLPSRGLHDLTRFEDALGHRAHAAPEGTVQAAMIRA